MPVHPNFPGLKCHIYCNGRALDEFDPPDDEVVAPLTVVKYIIAQDDMEYLVHIERLKPFPSGSEVSAKIYVDGQHCASHSSGLGKFISILGTETFNGVVWKLRRFRFSKISVAEGGPKELAPELREQLTSIGIIRVIFGWCVTTGEHSGGSTSEVSLIPTGDVPKKAILDHFRSHQTTLGEPESVPAIRQVTGIAGAPFAMFEFRYGSHPPS